MRPWHLRYLVVPIWMWVLWSLLMLGLGWFAAAGGLAL
jgi:membrane associated rhomboid family serine protease